MTNQITQEQVNNAAWAACDTFRGAVDPAQYKDYILVMLFLKYINGSLTDSGTDFTAAKWMMPTMSGFSKNMASVSSRSQRSTL